MTRALRKCPSYGKDGRLSKKDAILELTSICPSLRKDQAVLLCSYLDYGAVGLLRVEHVVGIVRGALTNRRMFLSDFIFERLSKVYSDNEYGRGKHHQQLHSRLERLRWFFATFSPKEARSGAPEELDGKYPDNPKVNKKLFVGLYKKYAPSRIPPAHLWDPEARFAARNGRRRIDAVELSDMFKSYLGGDAFDANPAVAENNDDKKGVQSIMDRLDRLIVRSSATPSKGLTRVDWTTLTAEMSAAYPTTLQFERALLDACALDKAEWKRYAELNARKHEMGHPDLRAESFKEAEAEKMQALKSQLSKGAYEKYTKSLTNVLRKVGSSLLSCAGADLTLKGLMQAMCKAPSFGTDRKISVRDFSTCLATYGIPLSRTSFKVLAIHFDNNRSGYVSVDAVVEAVRAKLSETALAQRKATETTGAEHAERARKKWIRLVLKNMVPEDEKSWEMFTHTDGRPYWFCALTGERRWERPDAVAKRERQSKRDALSRDRNVALDQIAQLKREVEAAVLDHTTKLEDEHVLPLSSLALKLLPQSIGRQRQVEAMFLSHNAIRILPQGVMQLGCLTHLFLDCNSLTSLPDNFEPLSGLKLLDLSRNKLKSLPAEFGNDLRHLQVLKCDYNHMEELPLSMKSMSELTVLSVTHNKLARLFEHITPRDDDEEEDYDDDGFPLGTRDDTADDEVKLPKLKHLILNGNNMREVPTDLFSNSRDLERVDLHDNILGFVPKEVCMLAKLKVLHLNGNQLTSLADEWDYARELNVLSLQYNKLYKLPHTICKLKQLTTLRVSNNKLSDLPESISELKKLTTLHAHCNHLKRVPGGIVHMPRLQILTVHMNSLRDLPAELPASLVRLKAHSNDIASIGPRAFENGLLLEQLDLAKNRLVSLPECFNKLVNLTYLRLDGNPLSEKLRKVVQQGSFQSSDETSFGFVLRKLVDGLSMADMQARIDVAKNVSIEDALDVQRKQAKERLEGKEIVPLRPDQCKRVMERSMERFSSDSDPTIITESKFRDCLTVIGILLHTEDAEKLARLACKIFGRKNRAVVEYKKFINSIWRERTIKGLPKWYDIVIGKLVASMSVADIDLRVKVALEENSVDAALHVGLRQSSDYIIQSLENCFARYTSPAFPEKITISNFMECISVIGILLSHGEMKELVDRVSQEFGDGAFIDYKKVRPIAQKEAVCVWRCWRLCKEKVRKHRPRCSADALGAKEADNGEGWQRAWGQVRKRCTQGRSRKDCKSGRKAQARCRCGR